MKTCRGSAVWLQQQIGDASLLQQKAEPKSCSFTCQQTGWQTAACFQVFSLKQLGFPLLSLYLPCVCSQCIHNEAIKPSLQQIWCIAETYTYLCRTCRVSVAASTHKLKLSFFLKAWPLQSLFSVRRGRIILCIDSVGLGRLQRLNSRKCWLLMDSLLWVWSCTQLHMMQQAQPGLLTGWKQFDTDSVAEKLLRSESQIRSKLDVDVGFMGKKTRYGCELFVIQWWLMFSYSCI